MDFILRPQDQNGLTMIGVGSSGQIYKVDDDIVLKSGRVFRAPESDASPRDKWFYASECIFHFTVMAEERRVFRLLQKWPHPNVADPVDTSHNEGVYLRKYLTRSELGETSQSRRIIWYQDVVRGLSHLHSLGIAHSDLRIDNVLFDSEGRAVLCDFSASSRFGQPNPAQPSPSRPVPLNGLAETVSAATDRFAMASLMFQVEIGAESAISIADDGTLQLPKIDTGHQDLDLIILEAWLGRFSSTTEMLERLETLQKQPAPATPKDTASRDALRARVRQWRKDRETLYGQCLEHSLGYSMLT